MKKKKKKKKMLKINHKYKINKEEHTSIFCDFCSLNICLFASEIVVVGGSSNSEMVTMIVKASIFNYHQLSFVFVTVFVLK
jgi:hypothetical protein